MDSIYDGGCSENKQPIRLAAKWLTFIIVAVIFAGCSEPRIDATNEETAKASTLAVSDSLSSSERGEFQKIMAASAMSSGLKKSGLTKGGKITILDFTKEFHGMTGKEILKAK